MNTNRITEATHLGFASATSTASGIALIVVSGGGSDSPSRQSTAITTFGVSAIVFGIVFGLVSAYLAISAYLSLYKD